MFLLNTEKIKAMRLRNSKMIGLVLILLASGISEGFSKQFYDTFRGTPIGDDILQDLDERNATFWCAIEIEDCDPDAPRRLDGSCNNLKHPTRGAANTPFVRVLEPQYNEDVIDDPRLSSTGNSLPLARMLRTSLLSEGRVPDQKFTQLFVNLFVFMSSETVALHDTLNYVSEITYCCTPKGKTNRMCVPNAIPNDDPVHRFSDIRCLNMTRPLTYQISGCIPNNTTPERISSSTPLFDMSILYGSILNTSLAKLRLYQKGLLKYEVFEDNVWPPNTKSLTNICSLNQFPHETRCHDTPDNTTNSLLGVNLFMMWFWRNHNRVASELADMNPCWCDDRLFYTARDINLATTMQIFYYEMLPTFLGRENMLASNVISPSLGFRDLYDENIIPQVSLEFPFVLRWLHTMQEGNVRFYDSDGYYLRSYPIVNMTFRTGFLAVDNNLEYITHGSYRQGCGKADYVVDPDISEVAFGPQQKAADVFTNDLSKNRYFGFPPYVRYLEYCLGKSFNTFEDLAVLIDPERLEILRQKYENLDDIDLMAGMWVEKPISGGHAPPTFYCLVVDQLIRNMVSDRHWYERPNRPWAFTYEQLLEIRQANVARLLCDNGDKVTKIQSNAFLRIGPGNEIHSCEEIPKINLEAWKDPTCYNGWNRD